MLRPAELVKGPAGLSLRGPKVRRLGHPAWGFIAPAVTILALITIYPFIYAIYLSFHDVDITRPYLGHPFVGMANYLALLHDQRAHNAFVVSGLFLGGAVGLETVLGILVALFLHRYFRNRLWVVVLTLTPMLIPRVVVALLWRVMYNPLIGVIDYLLGLGGIDWVSNPKLALPSVIIADVWQWTPFIAVILLAGLEALPEDPFEAAQLDGASGMRLVLSVTLPLLAPVLTVAILFRLLDALRSFDLIFVLTGGGPGTRTETVDIFAYFVGIAQSGRISYAAAVSIVMLYVTLVFSTYLVKWIQAWRGGESL